MKKVNILGVEYEIIKEVNQEKCVNNNANGMCEFYDKKILLDNWEESKETFLNANECKNITLRHEIIHAFLFESGLAYNSKDNWALNEEMVDWIAIQFPKLLKAFRDVEVI